MDSEGRDSLGGNPSGTAQRCRLAMVPMQDYLGLDDRARINEPSTFGKNWRWRMRSGAFTDELAERCRRMAKWYGRTGEERIRKHDAEELA